MLKLFRSLVSSKSEPQPRTPGTFADPLASVSADGVDAFDVIAHLVDANGHPVLDWSAAQRWVEAAGHHLGVELGQIVCALLEREPDATFDPNPSAWSGAPERGAFYLFDRASRCQSRMAVLGMRQWS